MIQNIQDTVQVVEQGDVVTLSNRAQEVRSKLLKLKDAIDDNFFDLCDLLLEAQDGDYHVVWGFARFGDWVEQASDLDISSRQAYYYITISKKAAELGLTREMMKQAKISKLKEIFSLEPSEHGEEMRDMIANASSLSLDEVKEKVRKLRKAGGGEDTTYITLKIPASLKQVLDDAFELARKNYGDYVQNGEITEAPVAKCLEIVCASYIASGEQEHEGVETE